MDGGLASHCAVCPLQPLCTEEGVYDEFRALEAAAAAADVSRPEAAAAAEAPCAKAGRTVANCSLVSLALRVGAR